MDHWHTEPIDSSLLWNYSTKPCNNELDVAALVTLATVSTAKVSEDPAATINAESTDVMNQIKEAMEGVTTSQETFSDTSQITTKMVWRWP
jgi:hypothetical protein